MKWFVIACFLINSCFAKIYDCFLFFNEYEILEIRLNELYDYVDKFVIVEASEGFRGHEKPYNFEKAKDRFTQFADKIIYIQLEERLDTNNPWDRENWQRNQIMRGLTECDPEDLILISDVDEFVPGAVLPAVYEETIIHPMIGFWQKMYRWSLNRTTNQLWAGTAALRYKHLITTSPQEVRDRARSAKMTMWGWGWHFTSMGGYDCIAEKYLNFSHGSDQVISYDTWKQQMTAHPLVEIDDSYPLFIRENIAYLTHLGMIDPS